MRASPYAAVIALALLSSSGCSDDEPQAMPVTPSGAASVPASSAEPTPTPTSSPGPSPTPLSPFEGDPAVVALRAYLAASSEAINARNLELPEFVTLATAARASRHRDLYTEDLGDYYPGPPPAAVVGVASTSTTGRTVALCLLDRGFALDRQGGQPLAPRNVQAARVEMVLEAGQWKVDQFLRDPDRSCNGVALPEVE